MCFTNSYTTVPLLPRSDLKSSEFGVGFFFDGMKSLSSSLSSFIFIRSETGIRGSGVADEIELGSFLFFHTSVL